MSSRRFAGKLTNDEISSLLKTVVPTLAENLPEKSVYLRKLLSQNGAGNLKIPEQLSRGSLKNVLKDLLLKSESEIIKLNELSVPQMATLVPAAVEKCISENGSVSNVLYFKTGIRMLDESDIRRLVPAEYHNEAAGAGSGDRAFQMKVRRAKNPENNEPVDGVFIIFRDYEQCCLLKVLTQGKVINGQYFNPEFVTSKDTLKYCFSSDILNETVEVLGGDKIVFKLKSEGSGSTDISRTLVQLTTCAGFTVKDVTNCLFGYDLAPKTPIKQLSSVTGGNTHWLISFQDEINSFAFVRNFNGKIIRFQNNLIQLKAGMFS